MGSTPHPKRLAIPPTGLAAQSFPGPTPEAFAALTKKAMMTELKRLGIARGKSKARKAELVVFYRAHCEAPAELPPAEEHFPATMTLSPTIIIKTLSPPEQRELESLAGEEHFPTTTTLSPEVSYETLPPAERREVEDAVEEDRRINPLAEIAVNIGEASETNFFVGPSRDITAGGIFVATVTLLPIGTSVKLELGTEKGSPVVVEGDIAWISDDKDGMGIRFTRLDEDAIAAIEEFIQIRAPLVHSE